MFDAQPVSEAAGPLGAAAWLLLLLLEGFLPFPPLPMLATLLLTQALGAFPHPIPASPQAAPAGSSCHVYIPSHPSER